MNERTVKLALGVSLLANLFLAGALIGGAGWLKARPGMINAGSLRVAGAELPREERRAFRAALHEARRSVQTRVKDGQSARDQAARLLRQPVLDPVALSSALARVRADDLAVRASVEQRAVAFAATMPLNDRARLADAMAARSERRSPHK